MLFKVYIRWIGTLFKLLRTSKSMLLYKNKINFSKLIYFCFFFILISFQQLPQNMWLFCVLSIHGAQFFLAFLKFSAYNSEVLYLLYISCEIANNFKNFLYLLHFFVIFLIGFETISPTKSKSPVLYFSGKLLKLDI